MKKFKNYINRKYNKHMYTNLAFDGGGARGIAYVGAMRVLEEKDMMKDIKRVVGTSVGSIIATAVALGYTADQMEELLLNKNFNDFKDNSGYIIINVLKFFVNYGYYRGNEFTKWIEEIIKTKTDNGSITFKQVYEDYGKELIIAGTCLNRKKTIYFNHNDYPNMTIKEAIRISASIPFFFDAYRFRDEVYVDGGITDSYPFGYFNEDDKTLGFKLDFKLLTLQKTQGDRIYWMGDYLYHFMTTVLNRVEQVHVKDYYWKNTVILDALDVGITEFEIPLGKKLALIRIGYDTTKKFLEKKPE